MNKMMITSFFVTGMSIMGYAKKIDIASRDGRWQQGRNRSHDEKTRYGSKMA